MIAVFALVLVLALLLAVRRDSGGRLDAAVVAVALLVLLLHALNYLYFFVDDEGIPFVYAQSLLGGHGLRYNVQDAPVEGYSDFLHVWLATAILAAVRAAGASKIAVFFVGKAISLAFAAGIGWLTVRLLERLRLAAPPAALAGLAFVALAGPLAVWSASSLETAQFACIVLLLAYALSDDSGSVRSDRLAAGAAIVLILDRIDGFLYASALLAASLLFSPPDRRRILLRRVVVPLVVVFTAYQAWRLVYFHTLLTPPLTTKVLFKLRRHDALVVRLPDEGYATRFFNLSAWIPPIATALTLALAAARERRAAALALAAGLLTLYVAAVGDWMFGFRFFVALVPLFGIAIAWIVARAAAWRRSAAWALAALVIAIGCRSAYALERSYESYQLRPGWLTHPHGSMAAYFPFYGLQRALLARISPGDTLATNLGGFVPFMVGSPNTDNLGLCTRVFAELPTTDVIFTEVGRYSPMTAKPVLRAADAYLMYRAPAYIVEPGEWIARANGGRTPPEIFGGRYRYVARENDLPAIANRDWPWVLYARAAPLDEFHRCPNLYLENLVHVSSVAEVEINGEPVPAAQRQRLCRYLKEEEGSFSFRGGYDIDMRFGHPEVPVYELYISNLRASAPVRVMLTLASNHGVVYHETLDVEPGRALSLYERLPKAVVATRAGLEFSSAAATPVTVSLNDLRVQGQTPRLADFVARRLALQPSSCRASARE